MFQALLLVTAFFYLTSMATPIPISTGDGLESCPNAAPVTLFATDYSGFVSTLTLATADNGDYTLTKTATAKECGASPSWLTYDKESKTLYCSDESVPGSISAFSHGDDGSLTLTAKATTSGADVHSVIFGGSDGKRFIASAGYNGNLSVFSLPLTTDSVPVFNKGYPGPDPSVLSHIHQVVVDPSKQYVLAPDLGLDYVHVLTIDPVNGSLKEVRGIQLPTGHGPRHADFKVIGNQTFMYLATELSNEVATYEMLYSPEKLEFRSIDQKIPFPGELPPNMAVAEIRVVDNDIYVSNRNTTENATDDTITHFKIDTATGIPKYVEQATTHGVYPRTFAFNADSSLAAIGNQKSGTVVVVSRDASTGALSDDFVSVKLEGSTGLSSVIFAE